MALFDTLLKPALDSVNKLINDFHLSPEDKQKADEAMANIQAQAQAASDEQEVKLNQIAGDNIEAESKTGDKFTERARPAFLYLVYFILIFNYFLLPVIQLIAHKALSPIQLPDQLWFMFSSGYLGYVVARTADKHMALPGESNISLPFGISMSNSGKKG